MIAFATDAAHPDLTPDDQLAVAALARRGVRVTPAVWDSPTVDWSAFDAAVVRSTWDYHHRPADFAAWLTRLEQSSARVHNPAPFLRWNADKRYLLDLARAGVPTIPTLHVRERQATNLALLFDSFARPSLVIKPAIAAGARETWVATRDSLPSDQARLDALLTHSAVLVQPFVGEVTTQGEWSLIFFNGEFSHAVLKRPTPGDFRVQQEHGGSTTPATPPPYLVPQARHVLDALPHPPLVDTRPLAYARVDGLDLSGTFTLMELEALEPDLFLSTAPAAPDRFAAAILHALI
jgi:hypothetical protein